MLVPATQNPSAVQNQTNPARRRGQPPLTGTAAEIALAEPIRQRMLEAVRRAQRESRHVRVAQQYADIRMFLHEQASAQFWIRHQHLKPSQLNRLRFAAALDSARALLAPLRAAKAARNAARMRDPFAA